MDINNDELSMATSLHLCCQNQLFCLCKHGARERKGGIASPDLNNNIRSGLTHAGLSDQTITNCQIQETMTSTVLSPTEPSKTIQKIKQRVYEIKNIKWPICIIVQIIRMTNYKHCLFRNLKFTQKWHLFHYKIYDCI